MSKEPIITAVQKKREPGEFHDFQKDILESMSKMKSCDIIISISKKRATSGECKLKIDYNGKRLIPLNK
jgi:hypothetical protein